MIRIFFLWLWIAVAISGCAEMDVQQETERQATVDTSIDAYHAEHSGRPSYIIDAMRKKQIIREMLLDEVRLVLESQSIEGQQTERFWCEKNPISECPASCTTCKGLIVARWGSVIYLKGKGSKPAVIDIRHSQSNRPDLGAFFASDPHLTFELARLIDAGQIAVTMTLDQIRQTLPGHVLEEKYFCDKKPVPSCPESCVDCSIVFNLQGNAVYLDNKASKSTPRVVRIEPIIGK